MADRTLYLVFGNAAEGKEDEFNEWYDNVHVPDVLSIPGMLTAQRFKITVPEMMSGGAFPPPTHQYLTVYEMEGDVDAIMGKIGEAVATGAMAMSDALDVNNVAMSYWTPLGPKVES